VTLLEPPCAPSLPIATTHDRLLCVRRVTYQDTALLADLITRMSENARRLRFFRPLLDPELIEQEAALVTRREPQLGAALVATTSEHGQVCAVALAELAHDPAAPATADLAVMVRDDYQRLGVGTLLLQRLIELARWRDVRRLHATLRAENQATRGLLPI